jgi:hypothetical protein
MLTMKLAALAVGDRMLEETDSGANVGCRQFREAQSE